MLKEIFDTIGYDIMPQSEFNMYPKITDRTSWENISCDVRKEVIKEAEKYLDYKYPMLPTSMYMKFVNDGNRSEFEAPYHERRTVLGTVLMAECIENKGRFLNVIIDGIYCICEETTWVIPAHNCKNRYYGNDFSAIPLYNHGIIDLFSSSTAKLISLAYYLMKDVFDSISPEITAMIEREIDFRILKPYMQYSDGFWMRETNNWNVHVNYYCFITFMLMAKENELRSEFLKKFVSMVDIYLDAYNDDGGCDEGPHYWFGSGGNVFKIAELLKFVTYGKCNLFEIEKIRNIGAYIAKVHIYDNTVPAISDGGRVVLGDFARLYGFGKMIGNKAVMKIAKLIEEKKHIYDDIDAVRMIDEVRAFEADAEKEDFVGFPDLQLTIWREDDIYMAIKAGHNKESHNHNDVGSFILYKNNKPVIIDVGTAPFYTSKTFSPKRYEIWYTNSRHHNVPQIGDMEQQVGREFTAENFSCDREYYSADIGRAYGEGIKWNRSVAFNRAQKEISFSEKYSLQKEEEIILAFMTEEKPVISENCVLLNEGVKLYFDGAQASFEEIIPEKEYVIEAWENVYKVMLKFKGKEGIFNYGLQFS